MTHHRPKEFAQEWISGSYGSHSEFVKTINDSDVLIREALYLTDFILENFKDSGLSIQVKGIQDALEQAL